MKRDPYHNFFSYQYDPLTHKVTKCKSSSITSYDQGELTVIRRTGYDSLGRKNIEEDGNGEKRLYRYNAYGSLTEICHPNGSKELYRYRKNGKLVSYTTRDGLMIHYEYDLLGRMIKETHGKEGVKQYFYQGMLLVKEIDLEDHETTYCYDAAGRKVSEERCGRKKEFSYDALGQLVAIQEDGLLTKMAKDCEGHLLEESKYDLQGSLLKKISYRYNDEGRVEKIIRSIEGKEAAETITYDSLGRKIAKKDALGHTTTLTHDDEKHIVTSLDPKKIVVKEFYDSYQRLIKKESYD